VLAKYGPATQAKHQAKYGDKASTFEGLERCLEEQLVATLKSEMPSMLSGFDERGEFLSLKFRKKTMKAMAAFRLDDADMNRLRDSGLIGGGGMATTTPVEWSRKNFDAEKLLAAVALCVEMLEEKVKLGHKICTYGCCGVAQWRNLAIRVLGLLTLRVGATPNEVPLIYLSSPLFS
jgi:hypothetical protein